MKFIRRYVLLRKQIINNEKGMTLLEVLVALVILSCALVPMLDGFTQASRLNSDTYRHNEALALAQSKIEEMKTKDFDSVINVPQTSCSLESDYSQYTGLTYAITVEDSGIRTKTVTVAVAYTDGEIPKHLELMAEIRKR